MYIIQFWAVPTINVYNQHTNVHIIQFWAVLNLTLDFLWGGGVY